MERHSAASKSTVTALRLDTSPRPTETQRSSRWVDPRSDSTSTTSTSLVRPMILLYVPPRSQANPHFSRAPHLVCFPRHRGRSPLLPRFGRQELAIRSQWERSLRDSFQAPRRWSHRQRVGGWDVHRMWSIQRLQQRRSRRYRRRHRRLPGSQLDLHQQHHHLCHPRRSRRTQHGRLCTMGRRFLQRPRLQEHFHHRWCQYVLSFSSSSISP